jgi:hypothetical protein
MSAAARPATPRTRIEEAKARFTIPVLWRMFNLRGEPGKSCRSPFREDCSPSFSVSEDGLRFIDFGTGERGDAISFLAKIRGISNPEAFLELLKMAEGIMPEPTAPARAPEVKMNAPSQPLLPGLETQEGGAAV